MLPRLKILQVGDIHFPSEGSVVHLDDQDETFPERLKTIIATSPLRSAFRKIGQMIEKGDVDALLFMGDFTDRGNIDGYQSCLEYLTASLQIGAGRANEALPVGIVPGNHDVDRTLAKNGLVEKFEPLSAAINQAGLPAIPVSDPRMIVLQKGAMRSTVYLMNSCWGCGEQTQIPAPFQKEIAQAIDAVIAGNPDAVNTYYDRQLDTPALSEESIQTMIDDMANCCGESMPIIVAHHNILPQRLSRLAPYTELVNSGALRAALLDCGKSTLYLHGHIHEDPIEIMQTPGAHPLVSISAPPAVEGFNVLEIVYSQTGQPIAVTVRPFRVAKSGLLQEEARHTVPLGLPGKRWTDPLVQQLYSGLLRNIVSYWSDVMALGQAMTPPIPEDRLIETVEILAATGAVTIQSHDSDRVHWVVQTG